MALLLIVSDNWSLIKTGYNIPELGHDSSQAGLIGAVNKLVVCNNGFVSNI